MPSRRVPIVPRLAHVLAVVLVGLAAAALTPCAGCSCPSGGSLVDSAARGDVVFVGTAVGVREPGGGLTGVVSSADEVGVLFEVAEVRKGSAGARTEVLTAASGGSCGLEVEKGSAYVVVARSTPAGLTAGLCDGTRLRSTVPASDLDAVGAAHSPQPGAVAADVPERALFARDAVRSQLVLGAVLTGVAGLLALAVTLVVRGRRKVPESPASPLR